MDIVLLQDFKRVNIGLDVQLPHEKVTLISVGLVFWTALIVIGATIGKDDES